MERTSQSSTGLRASFLTWVLGFLGIAALIKFLPRTLSYATRRWVLGLITELVVVVLAGLLTEKLADRMIGRNGVAPSRSHPETSEAPTHDPFGR